MDETVTKSIDFSLFSEAGINASKERIEELSRQINLFRGCETRDEKVRRLQILKSIIIF